MRRSEKKSFFIVTALFILSVFPTAIQAAQAIPEEASVHGRLNGAIQGNDIEEVSRLIDEEGAADVMGIMSLSLAICELQNIDMVRLLLDNGAVHFINERDHDAGETPLFNAVYNGNIAIATLLIENGAGQSVDTPRNDGYTPLGYCEHDGAMTEFLRANGATVFAVPQEEAEEEHNGENLAQPALAPNGQNVFEGILDIINEGRG